MIERSVIFDSAGRPLVWPGVPGSNGGHIPDSRSVWDHLWENMGELGGVAHTHPWSGNPAPSHMDVTTFSAIEAGLGMVLLWPIVTMDRVRIFKFDGSYYAPAEDVSFEEESYWINTVRELRKLSSEGG